METRANYVIVGIFTLAAILAAFAFVYWTAAIGDRGESVELRVRIPGSASGLSRGSAVSFNGVKVGDVRRVFIDVDNPTVAIADTVVDRYTPITRSTQADIGLAGLTGQANIELKGTDSKGPNILAEAQENGTVAEITANPSAVTNLLQTAQDIFKRADNVLNQLEGFVGDARGPLTQTAMNAQKFSDALAKNADGIDTFLTSVTSLSEELAGVSGKLDGTLEAAEGLLKSVDREKVATIVGNVETFTKSLSDSSDEITRIMASADATLQSVDALSKKATDSLAKVDSVVGAVNPEDVRIALANIAKASETANRAASDVAKVTEKFGKRADDIDQMVGDAKQLAQRLNQASVRVDGILVKVDNLLGSGQTEGLMADASRTLKSFKQVADTLNGRLGVITDGFAKFSTQGLGEIEALARDSRRSITRIEEAVTDLSRNPQKILSGGEGEVRQYDGRARR
ncbi:MCE family protein [Mesorhizobium sp. NBSH29]|uniref:MlaD family protein n=1 Tax=Mesorhizobium sp. NBSH29 TaxID=2654249 RepID=UPI0018966337|nr:MlaD family protein [Mesorhizobium sp. NBSH29]QPC87957.1 MCE family protein [Mesorhizobium sp. NBSH29]